MHGLVKTPRCNIGYVKRYVTPLHRLPHAMPYSGISEHQTLKRFCSRHTPELCHTLFYRERASPLRLETFNVDPVKHVARYLQSSVDDNGLRSDKCIPNEQENSIGYFFWTTKTPDRDTYGKLLMGP